MAFPFFGARVAVKVGLDQGTEFVLGNATIAGQIAVGSLSLFKGSCSLIDASITTHPMAKALYCVGGVCQLSGAAALLTSSVLSYICPPYGLVLSGAGQALRSAGFYTIVAANRVNPAPAISKAAEVLSD